jgi:hypothetical protein
MSEPPGSKATSPWARALAWVRQEPWRHRFALALALYVLCTIVYVLFAPTELFSKHTPYNHFAHLAQAWLNGHLDLASGAPAYAHNNDFAVFEGKTYVTFPPFPALLLLPLVWFAGSPEAVLDGQAFLLFAAAGPALLFLALERLREAQHTARTVRENLALSVCFAFGTVFFFSVEQGTVWFAAHGVGVVLGALYLLFAVNARYPVWAGLVLGLGFLTRAPLLFAAPLFCLEACRVSLRPGAVLNGPKLGQRLQGFFAALDMRRCLTLLLLFALPLGLCVALSWWHNAARFHDPFEPGYRYLTVAWQERINKWGLFHYHYLAKNLGVVLTSLPWVDEDSVFKINVHGLALWFTTPLYFWLLWPRQKPWMHFALLCTAVLVAVPTLLYQNTGWAQFGYRFSNDYAVFLFALLAVGMRPLRGLFALAAVFSMLVNGFGAGTFQRKGYEQFYFWQGSQKTLYQPD